MRVLFIHRHFPGPFWQLAENFGRETANTVLYLSERSNRQTKIPGVRRLRVGPPTTYEGNDAAEKEAVLAQRRGAQMANTLLRLRKDGFSPDLIICASNDGYSLYLRDIFPDALIVARAEWFFTKGESHTFFTHGKPRPAVDFAPARIRNLFQYNSLGDCDAAISSTEWQKSQYPPFLRDKIQVIPEGVDVEYFTPWPGMRFVGQGFNLTNVPELVTFSSRRPGPSRGLAQFCESLPLLLDARPNCHILVMASPPENGDRKNLGKENTTALLGTTIDPRYHNRINVAEFTNPEQYRMLLRASTVHVYLTAPYTLSGGLFEALSCGTLVVGSDTPPVREIVKHGQNGFLTDFWDYKRLAETLSGVLDKARQFEFIRQAARATVVANYDMVKQAARQQDFMQTLMRR